MAPLTTTRTLFELRIGSTHTIEVLLQLRSSDLPWWNSDLYNHERQLYKLIGRRVLPIECRKEIENDLEKLREDANFRMNDDKKKKRKKGDVVVGEANLKKKAAENEKSTTGGRKRGRGNRKAAANNKETKSSKKQKLSEQKAKEANTDNSSDLKEKKLKLLREPGKWIMGKSIQMCYMMEDIDETSATTMIFRNKENTTTTTTDTVDSDNNNKMSQSSTTTEKQCTKKEAEDDDDKIVPLATFRSWKKLNKRLTLWVFQFDPDDPSDLSVSEGGGFPRPELLPMADIFRSAG